MAWAGCKYFASSAMLPIWILEKYLPPTYRYFIAVFRFLFTRPVSGWTVWKWNNKGSNEIVAFDVIMNKNSLHLSNMQKQWTRTSQMWSHLTSPWTVWVKVSVLTSVIACKCLLETIAVTSIIGSSTSTCLSTEFHWEFFAKIKTHQFHFCTVVGDNMKSPYNVLPAAPQPE